MMALIFLGAMYSMQRRDVCISIDVRGPTRNMRKLMPFQCVMAVSVLIRFQGMAFEEDKK